MCILLHFDDDKSTCPKCSLDLGAQPASRILCVRPVHPRAPPAPRPPAPSRICCCGSVGYVPPPSGSSFAWMPSLCGGGDAPGKKRCVVTWGRSHHLLSCCRACCYAGPWPDACIHRQDSKMQGIVDKVHPMFAVQEQQLGVRGRLAHAAA